MQKEFCLFTTTKYVIKFQYEAIQRNHYRAHSALFIDNNYMIFFFFFFYKLYKCRIYYGLT